MGMVKVSAFSLSLDGFGAGPKQDINNPLGIKGGELHHWMYKTRMFHQMIGKEGGTTDFDNDMAEKSMENVGAWIMGRHMFGPVHGPWPDETWRGWWGEEPPYHTPVFVLTHHKRQPLVMTGGTTFYFVNDSIESVLKQAKEKAQNKDIRIGGGVAVIRQYLQAGLIDELHLVYSPVFLGAGESLLAGINLPSLGYNSMSYTARPDATHMFLRREDR